MKKIVLLPLDERPCNYQFPFKLFNSKDLSIVRPEKMGFKKTPADTNYLREFLLNETINADCLIVSIDTLLYGGLIPSRIHHFNEETLLQQLDTIKQIRKKNPSIIIYACSEIMRCPTYSNSDEEPDYYDICGAEIHKIGSILHKKQLGIIPEDDNTELDELKKIAKPEYLNDFVNRRAVNLNINLACIDLAKENYIDYLIIPQDDSAEYGFTALDQIKVRDKISKEFLHTKVSVYPGADEIALTLLSRYVNKIHNKRPKVFVKYNSNMAPFVIPPYEDRTIAETIKWHLLSAGCEQVYSKNEADFILALNAPANKITESIYQPITNKDYSVERNLSEFAVYIKNCIDDGIPVTICDTAYMNGADLELVGLLNHMKLLMQVAGYSGWNTHANSLGTAIAEGVHYLYNKNNDAHKDFLALRYVEDAGYCSHVRKLVAETKLDKLGFNYFNVKESKGIVSQIVKEELRLFIDNNLTTISDQIILDNVYMPWCRMFEVGIDLTYTKK